MSAKPKPEYELQVRALPGFRFKLISYDDGVVDLRVVRVPFDGKAHHRTPRVAIHTRIHVRDIPLDPPLPSRMTDFKWTPKYGYQEIKRTN